MYIDIQYMHMLISTHVYTSILYNSTIQTNKYSMYDYNTLYIHVYIHVPVWMYAWLAIKRRQHSTHHKQQFTQQKMNFTSYMYIV